MECEVLDVVPTVGDKDLHFQAVVQVRAALLMAARVANQPASCVCGVVKRAVNVASCWVHPCLIEGMLASPA
jgi:hypothetical protein